MVPVSLWKLANESGEAFEIVTPTSRTNRNSLLQRAIALAEVLQSEIGVEEGEIVTILAQSPEIIVAGMIAISYIGRCGALCGPMVFPQVPSFPSSRAIVVQVDSNQVSTISDVSRVISIDGGIGVAEIRRDSSRSKVAIHHSLQHSSEPFLLFRTSGTSGFPRWVIHSEGSLRESLESRLLGLASGISGDHEHNDAQAVMAKVALAPRAVFVGMDTISGYTQLVHCLFLGIPLIVMPTIYPRKALRLAREFGAGTLVTIPSILRLMMTIVSSKGGNWADLGVIGLGGGNIEPSLLSSAESMFGARVIQGYGSTELGGAVTNVRIWDPPTVRHFTVGRALNGVAVEVRRGDGRVAEANEQGELWVKSPHRVALGYFEPQFWPVIKPLSLTDGWYRTRDAGLIDQDGNVVIYGRLDDRICRGEEKFFAQEIEMIIESHPSVAYARVLASSHKTGRVELLAQCQLWDDAEAVSGGEIRRWCKERLRRVRCPDVVEISALTVTATGKVVRRTAPAMDSGSASEGTGDDEE